MKITKYRASDKPGALLAFFSICYETPWGLRYDNDMQLLQKNGHRWIAFASKQYKNANGETRYFPLSGFENRAGHEKFQKLVIHALDLFCANGEPAKHENFDSATTMQYQMPPMQATQYKDEELPF
jgi:hypothetical protein